MENNNSVLLEMKDICKSFPGVKALDRVSLTGQKRGTVHALMGENGAGKSTLMKCLFGIYSKDGGHHFVEMGREVNFKNSKEALETRRRHGAPGAQSGPQAQCDGQHLARPLSDHLRRADSPLSAKMLRGYRERYLNDMDIQVDPRTIMSAMPVSHSGRWWK